MSGIVHLVTEISRLADDDWSTLRDLRLAALTDAPTAFGSTLTDELPLNEQAWRARVRDSAWFVATVDGRPVGLARGGQADSAGEWELLSMWVAPAHRGRGASTQLVDAVISWGQANGAGRFTLWVTEGNEPARRLYARHGFVPTGQRQPLPSNPDLHEIEMAHDLNGS